MFYIYFGYFMSRILDELSLEQSLNSSEINLAIKYQKLSAFSAYQLITLRK